MKYIRRKTGTDIGITENDIIVMDHMKYKYIKIRRNNLIDDIIKLTKSISTEDEIIRTIGEKYLYGQVSGTIKKMIEIGVLEVSSFPDGISLEEMRKVKMPEGAVDKRFALEIAALKEYEKDGHDRFEVFNRIRSAEATIIGAGGVGSNLAVMLTAYGLKKITIIDDDYVEMDNLVRQVFYKETDCGKEKKAIALKRFLNDFSSYTEIVTMEKYIMSDKDADTYLSGSQLVIQTADRPKGYIDFWVNRTCVDKKIPVLFTHNGTIGPFYIPGESACFECFSSFLEEESKGLYLRTVSNLERNTGSIYPADVFGAWYIAYYLACEVVDYIMGINKPKSINSLVKVSEGNLNVISLDRKKNCNCCQ